MLNRIGIKLVRFLLSRDLTVDERNALIIHIIDKLNGLPIRGIISTTEGGEILVNGHELDIEKLKQLRESARLALDNIALKVINEQVLFEAVSGGVHKVENPLQMYFFRAAIWFSQQIESQLRILAQREPDSYQD